MTLLPNESPEQLARGLASNDTADAELMPTLAPARSEALPRHSAIMPKIYGVSHQDHAYAIFLALCQSDDCISSLLRSHKRL
jgi:hypothetical protein